MKKINIKSKNAITLISLVVTIVVVVVVSAVAINIAVGKNGLVLKTQTARREYVNSMDKENQELGTLINDIDEMAAVDNTRNLDGYMKIPTETLDITENGEDIDVLEYSKVNVNVPIPEGFVRPVGTQSITTNGEHDVSGFEKVNVNVGMNLGRGQVVINQVVSNGQSSNTKSQTWVATGHGLVSYAFACSNNNGSNAKATLNGTVINSVASAIGMRAGIVEVNANDSLYLYAYGTKGSTSNASAYIYAVFYPIS